MDQGDSTHGIDILLLIDNLLPQVFLDEPDSRDARLAERLNDRNGRHDALRVDISEHVEQVRLVPLVERR